MKINKIDPIENLYFDNVGKPRSPRRVKMKNYHAWFQNERQNTAITIACDGVSETHANARAWLKFMATQAFKEDKDNWKLEALDQVFN